METIHTDMNHFIWSKNGIQIHSGIQNDRYDWGMLKDGKYLTTSLMGREIYISPSPFVGTFIWSIE